MYWAKFKSYNGEQVTDLPSERGDSQKKSKSKIRKQKTKNNYYLKPDQRDEPMSLSCGPNINYKIYYNFYQISPFTTV